MRSTSRAPPFTEKWFWFKADPQRTGAYAYASERVHSISFICRIIAVFLFAAQGRANARVHEPKVSSSALHRGCAASVILPTRHRASMLVFARPFSSSSLRRKWAAPHSSRDLRREILPLERKEERDPLIFLFSPRTGEKNLLKREKSIERKERFFFSGFMCFVVHRKLESFFSRILFDHIRSRNFLIFLLSCYYCYYYFFLKTNPSVSCEVNFLMQFFVDKSSITRTFFLFSYSCI